MKPPMRALCCGAVICTLTGGQSQQARSAGNATVTPAAASPAGHPASPQTLAVHNTDKIPDGVEIRGKLVCAYAWDDKSGGNLLVLASNDDDITLCAAQYLLQPNRPHRVRMLSDGIKACGEAHVDDFDPDTAQITDLGGAGVAEVTRGCQLCCFGDVSRRGCKLVMHAGKDKYALRGSDRFGVPMPGDHGGLVGTPLPSNCSADTQRALRHPQGKPQAFDELRFPGRHQNEDDVAKAPPADLRFMQPQGFARMRTAKAAWLPQLKNDS